MRGGFTIVERFDPSHEGWAKYVAWSGLTQLTEVIGLDGILCPTLLGLEDDVWEHIIEEALPEALAVDRAWLVNRHPPAPDEHVLFVVREPLTPHPGPSEAMFVRAGYELLEHDGSISALTNCGGFPLAFDNAELNDVGLLSELSRARDVQAALRAKYPAEPHAIVDVFEIWREVR